MLTLLRIIILRNWRSLAVLFSITVFASIAFITLGQLTTNIESSVASETRPLFGADMIVAVDGYTGASLHEIVSPYLAGESYTWAERHEFSTTLLDRESRIGLVQVLTYKGTYPQRGILSTESLSGQEQATRVSATPDLITRFASGGILILDGRDIVLTDRIIESSDLGFGFGTDNHLLILPESLLSGSLLLSSGSRLSYDLLISFADESRADIIKKSLESSLPKERYPIRTYTERTERSLDTVASLTQYILLILVISSIFALVILRSAHDSFFDSLSRTLRIIETLGFSRRRQQILFAIVYSLILPLGFAIAGAVSSLILSSIATYPQAESFHWFFSSFSLSLLILMLLLLAAFAPAWLTRWFPHLESWSRYGLGIRTLIELVVGVVVIALIFSDFVFALGVVLGGGVALLILSYLLTLLYQWIFARVRSTQFARFAFFDGIRSLVRPLTPTLPITISLVSVTTFFIVFVLFSLALYDKLNIDTGETANIYALNILESDRVRIEATLTGSDAMYSVLRARISKINGQSLSGFLNTERPSGEFTREFSVTITPLENKILRGVEVISRDEVSVDDEFARRLGVDIGDSVEFLLSGRPITLTIANIRESKRQGFQPFFYFSFDPRAFASAPHTYFVSAYTTDTEKWQKIILENSGPHVTFVDVENILSLVRDISNKVLSVIGLFVVVVSLFALFAVISFFARMRAVEAIRSRLYRLFGLIPGRIISTLRTTRLTILLVSLTLSLIISTVLIVLILRTSTILVFSWASVGIVGLGAVAVYLVLTILLRPRI